MFSPGPAHFPSATLLSTSFPGRFPYLVPDREKALGTRLLSSSRAQTIPARACLQATKVINQLLSALNVIYILNSHYCEAQTR